jgi:hypothetical protein
LALNALGTNDLYIRAHAREHKRRHRSHDDQNCCVAGHVGRLRWLSVDQGSAGTKWALVSAESVMF